MMVSSGEAKGGFWFIFLLGFHILSQNVAIWGSQLGELWDKSGTFPNGAGLSLFSRVLRQGSPEPFVKLRRALSKGSCYESIKHSSFVQSFQVL